MGFTTQPQSIEGQVALAAYQQLEGTFLAPVLEPCNWELHLHHCCLSQLPLPAAVQAQLLPGGWLHQDRGAESCFHAAATSPSHMNAPYDLAMVQLHSGWKPPLYHSLREGEGGRRAAERSGSSSSGSTAFSSPAPAVLPTRWKVYLYCSLGGMGRRVKEAAAAWAQLLALNHQCSSSLFKPSVGLGTGKALQLHELI